MDWQRNITAASGYLDLGMGQEAWDELDTMPPPSIAITIAQPSEHENLGLPM